MSDETKQGILSLTIKDRTVLYAAYMPFLRNGGLFIPTNKRFALGEEVFVLLALMDEAEKIPINRTVVWVTPKGAQGNRQAGIGVQFSEADFAAATKIEEHLGTGLVSDRPTHTM
ncbi:PilZ domain-containing protein [Luminiphilus sp.]|nr:PilZ domain-containing protein [Luminiphilus sp.]